MQTHVRMVNGEATRPSLADALHELVPRLGWRLVRTGQSTRIIFLKKLSVSDATLLQLNVSLETRRIAHASFIREAHDKSVDTSVTGAEHSKLEGLFSSCWSLKWENKQKEIFWRVTVDGVADGHRWVGLGDRRCACGVGNPGREHFFWSCPVAQAVVQTIRECCPGQPVLCKADIWLMQPPLGVPQQIWLVVCMAAMTSMDRGRRKLLTIKLQQSSGRAAVLDPEYGARPRRVFSRGAFVRSNAEKVHVASEASVLAFWSLLGDFAALNQPPQGAGVSTPFVRLDGGFLKCNNRV